MLLILPSTASAKVNVEISNNLDGSKNSVKVNSNTSNYQSSNTPDSHTDIVINNNGEVKEYHGSGEDINIQSGDGKSTVSVKNNSATNSPSPTTSSKVTTRTNITVNSNTSDDSSPSASSSPAVAGVSIDISGNKEEKAGLWAGIKKQLAAFFKLFS